MNDEGHVYTSVCLHNDEDLLLGGSANGAIKLWSMNSDKLKYTMMGHHERVSATEFLHYSKQFVTASYDRSIKLCDLIKGSVVKNILCWSRCEDMKVWNESLAVSGHYDHSIKIHSLKTGEKITEIKELHCDAITSVCLSPDGNYLVTGSEDNTCRIVDMRTYAPLPMVMQYESQKEDYINGFESNRVCFGHNGKSVIAGGANGHIYVWDAADGKLCSIKKGNHKSHVTGCYYNKEMGFYYTTDGLGNMCIWKNN